ncbi:beta-ketoacyl synthase N-terminal-like domain-containing protein, partial [Streptomyces sp. NPDC051105]|uniref:beta-ketoacyl synthase N-terminal-like domain-containing protein n=1 Tax=Streptomyces sp. NPDC051105 TaxID=3154843 RepID=UPI00343D3F71
MVRNIQPNVLAVIGLGQRPGDGPEAPSVTTFDRDFFSGLSGTADNRHLLLLETAWTAWEDAGLIWSGTTAQGEVAQGEGAQGEVAQGGVAQGGVAQGGVAQGGVAQHLTDLLTGPPNDPANPASALWTACGLPTEELPEVVLVGGATDSDGPGQPGCAVLALKPLERALADGDRIRCTIRTGGPEAADMPAEACGQDLTEVARAIAEISAGARSRCVLSTPDHTEHLLLDAAVPVPAGAASVTEARTSARVFPVVLSARGDDALRAQARQLSRHLGDHPELDAADVAHALTTRRTAWEHRAVAVADGRERMLEALDTIAEGRHGTEAAGIARATTAGARDVVFVFPGHGPQWAGMGADLFATDDVFRDQILRCEEAFKPYLDYSVSDVVTGELPLDRLDMAQPALFSVMVALAAMWRSNGITPAAVLGHSFGDTAAATAAGVLSLDEGARLVAAYGRAQMQIHGKGDMLAVALPYQEVTTRIGRWGGRLELAVVNGPMSSVVSGDPDSIRELQAELAAEEVRTRLIPFGVAAHSHQVQEIEESLLHDLAAIAPKDSAIPFYTSTTGGRVAPHTLDARYWYRNLRNAARFDQATTTALRDGRTLFLEVSPHPVVTMSIEETATALGIDVQVGATLRRGEGGQERFLQSLGELHVHGGEPDWNAVFGRSGEPAPAIPLPTYPFQRRTTADDGPPHPRAAFVQVLSGLPQQDQIRMLLDLVYETIAELTEGDRAGLSEHRDFRSLGFDSLLALSLRNTLNQRTGLRLPATVAFDFPTPRAMADRIRAEITGEPLRDDEAGTPPEPAGDPDEPIAIVGIGCRLPGGASSPEELWRLVADEVSTVGPYPEDRGWDLYSLYNEDPSVSGTFYQREVSFLPDVAGFDAGFFGISPREALAMDPQQRLVLETSWEALERAGIDPHTLRGSDTSVFIGAAQLPYGPQLQDTPPEVEGYALTGTTSSVTSGRVAYVLGLEGPAITVDTACSSSLVAMHLACRSLRTGESSLALAGGVTVHSLPGLLTEFSRQRGLSADGRCRSFSDDADGFGMAEGAGVLVLERLSDARRLGHRVSAVIRGSAVNQDG